MIKAVIFDLDGTLVNAYPAVIRSVNYTLGVLGQPRRSDDEIIRSVGGGDGKLIAHFAGPKRALEALSIYRRHHAKALRLKGAVKLLPGAGPLLKYLKANGYKLAIASNRPTKFAQIILKVLGIGSLFDVVLCADRAPKPKPYPDMLWAIAERLKLEKSQALYVGDMTIDIQCGRRAGMRMVAVATGSSSKKELKDLKPYAIVDKISQIKTIGGLK